MCYGKALSKCDAREIGLETFRVSKRRLEKLLSKESSILYLYAKAKCLSIDLIISNNCGYLTSHFIQIAI